MAAGEDLDVPEPAAEFFSSRAKALLDIEMDSPTVATVQALVVMSASEAAFTRDARGWLYSGQYSTFDKIMSTNTPIRNGGKTKCRPRTPYGYYPTRPCWPPQPARPRRQKNSVLGRLRSREVWNPLLIRPVSLFTHFISMWSIYVGRPWGISLQDITTPRPLDYMDVLKGKTWKPYPAACGKLAIPNEGIFHPLEACTAANIMLCEIMRRVNNTLSVSLV